MISLSSVASVPFVPSWMEGRADAHRYMLRAASVFERSMFEADLAGYHQAEGVFWLDLDIAFEAGVRALCSADDAKALIELQRDERAAKAENIDLDAAQTQTLSEARRVLGEHWPDYRALIVRSARREAILPVLAFQRFCTGWEGLSGSFEAGPNGQVTEAALSIVPPLELRAAGIEAYQMMYAASAEKNSAAPSNSSAAPATSNAGAKSKAGGRSARRTGRKTPA